MTLPPPVARATAPVPAPPPPKPPAPAEPGPPTVQLRPLLALAGNATLAAGETVAAVGGAPAFVALAAAGAVAAVGTVMSRTHAHRARRAARRPLFDRPSASGRSTAGGGGLGRLFGGRSTRGGGSGGTDAGRVAGTGRPAGATGRSPSSRTGGSGAGPGGGGSSSTGRRKPWSRRRRDRAGGRPGGAFDPGVPETKRRRWRKRGDDSAPSRGGKKPRRGKKPGKDRLLTTGPQPIPPRRPKPAGPQIAPKVTPTDATKPATPAPPAKPAQVRNRHQPAVSTAAATGGTPVTTPSPATGPSPMLAMLEIIENDFRKIVAHFDPRGIEEVIDEYERWPLVLSALANVWKQMRDIAEVDYPLPPVIIGLLETIDKHQRAVGTTSEEVPGLIRRILADRFADMQDPRNAMLDHRVNPNTAAQPRPSAP